MREDQIMQMRKELESARYNNSSLLDSNANLQAEIDALSNHIRVLQLQNEDLTKELDQFVEANEAQENYCWQRIKESSIGCIP